MINRRRANKNLMTPSQTKYQLTKTLKWKTKHVSKTRFKIKKLSHLRKSKKTKPPSRQMRRTRVKKIKIRSTSHLLKSQTVMLKIK